MGLQEYLNFCVGALERLVDFPVVHVVICNEACDLDSTVSAITYAYFLHETSTAPVGTALFLPFLNIPRSDFPLRTEVTHFLGKFGLTAAHLIFRDDLDLGKVKISTDLKVTLVDHHVLCPALSAWGLEENVVQILDHRPKDGDLPDRCESTLELVGSCTTLVAEVAFADETFPMDRVTATLLYGTILTDTINFSAAAGKTTPKDLDLAQRLEAVIGPEVDRNSIFQEIKEAKFDLSGLSCREVLLKDLKLVSGDSLTVAMCSVTMDMNALMGREDFAESLKSFAAEKKVDAVVIMTLSMGPDDDVTRQLGVFSPSRVYRQQMADVLNACQDPSLGLSPLPCSCPEEFLPFAQANTAASRKLVLPVVKAFLAGETTPDEAQLDVAGMVRDESENFTTSLSGMVEAGMTRQDTFDGEITSEDLTSRDNSTEVDLSSSAPEDNDDDVDGNLLLALPGDGGGGRKGFFDPLSSVHSSDSGAMSPTATASAAADSNRTDPETQLPAADEVEFDLLGGREAAETGSSGHQAAEESGPRVNFFLSEDSPSSPSQEPASQPGSQQFSQEPSDTAAVHIINNSNNNASGDTATTTTITSCNNNHNHQLPTNPDPSQHNGLGDREGEEEGQEEVDGLEEALLNMASPHDLLFPAVDSPLDLSAAPSGQGSGVASGQTSGHASKQPSYPVTPPNSYMDLEGGGGLMAKETHLPSFNSSEMVEKIQEKKAALSGGGGGPEDGESTPDFTLSPFSPFTPQNSYAETTGGAFPADYAQRAQRQTQLPSFHSSDMVERIREKRSSMERDLQGAGMLEEEEEEEKEEGGAGAGGQDPSLLAVANNPFTPHNSFVDANLERYAHDNLPSLNSAEITKKIRQKQAELADADTDVTDSTSGVPPFTPVNSYRERPLDALSQQQRVPDLNEVAERLSLTGSESSGSLSDPHAPLPRAIRPSNRVHQASSPQNSSSGGEGFPSGPSTRSPPASKKRARVVWEDDDDDDDDDIADEEEDETGEEEEEETGGQRSREKARHPPKRKGVSFVQPPSPEAEGCGVGGGGSGTKGPEDGDVTEAAIQKIAYELANEMIQRALETFPAGSVKQLVPEAASGEHVEGASGSLQLVSHPSISEDSSPTMDESDQDVSEEELDKLDRLSPGGRKRREEASDSVMTTSSDSERLSDYPPAAAGVPTSGSLADELAQAIHGGGGEGRAEPEEEEEERVAGVSKSESYEIETEYLSEMDPMHCVHSPTDIIQTDADREVVEGASFRKISGQEYQTVQNEILEEIRQEARERDLAKRRQSSVAEEDLIPGSSTDNGDDAAAHGGATEAEKRRIAAEVELNLDDSLTAEGSKKTIHVIRDRELYASALENVNLDDDDEEEELAAKAAKKEEAEKMEKTLQPSNAAHPLLDSLADSRTEEENVVEAARKKIPASKFEGREAAMEKQHRYESLVEASGMQAGRKEEEIGRRAAVARTVSGASDSSAAGSVRGVGLKGAELQDEWQDDELPNIIGAESQALAGAPSAAENTRKKLKPDQDLAVIGDSLENVAVVDSDSEIDSDIDNEQLEWENDTPVRTPTKQKSVVEEVPEYTAEEERRDVMHWRMINVGDGDDFRLDMKVIEPYKRVLSHGGYYGDRMNAMVVFSACYLPSRDRRDYSYVMNHLFHYMIHTLDELVADDYIIVYFHGATPRRQMPSFNWLKRCYQGIDRRLKKNLKALYLVHPTLWLKTVVLMTRPFISAKFSSKLQFVRTLADLKVLIPMEYVYIPEIVQRYDDRHFHPSSPSSSHASPQ